LPYFKNKKIIEKKYIELDDLDLTKKIHIIDLKMG
jgi:hypothetical protein